ncbi:carbohydrate ABC transporter permease [Paenibacillus sp. IB182496]|uniref:Carbohydrate ABC transporter permease n=1 Tax=Paenibacillus sabuli TaxID=2772509 RepID=A0A927BQS2_9BACL|nr:carbohydrate ABC transporter permease [Paenibacillus sabuli]MBD2843834.1 carbohydrate ABC transporter permease [Paenibacillus sabuli]
MVTNKSERTFQWINSLFFALLSLSMIAPLIHLLAVSLSAPKYANAKLVVLWPKGFNLDVYETIFGLGALWRAMGVSIWITVIGTLLTLALCSSLSYAVSRRQMRGRIAVLQGILITFIFSAPLVPTYLVIRGLGMENTLWALIVPSALNAFYVLIMKTFFAGISGELFDSGKIDGCSEPRIYASIVMPLSKPVLATIALFHAVTQWNSYFQALLFIRSRELYPLQIILRNMVIEDEASAVVGNMETVQAATPEMMKAGVILFATVPILIVYPFLQRFFVKGAMLGSLKE